MKNIKIILCMILIVTTLTICMSAADEYKYHGGAGTASDPYLIQLDLNGTDTYNVPYPSGAAYWNEQTNTDRTIASYTEPLITAKTEGCTTITLKFYNSQNQQFTNLTYVIVVVRSSADYSGPFSSVVNWLSNIWDNISSGFTNVINIVRTISTAISNLSSSISSWLTNLGTRIINGITGFFAFDVEEAASDFNGLKNSFTFIQPLTTGVIQIISRIEYFSDYYEQLFAEDANTEIVGDRLQLVDEPNVYISIPNIKINLSASNSQYDYGSGIIKVIDFSWFIPYKPSYDRVMTIIIVIFFVWRLAHNVPNIIQGVSSVTNSKEFN